MRAVEHARSLLLRAGTVVTPDRLLQPGWVHVAGDRVAGVGAGEPPRTGQVTVLPPGSIVVPGLVDMHVHGAGGGDMTAGDRDGTVRSLRALLAAGVTSSVASLVTVPEQELLGALDVLGGLVRDPAPGATRLLGTHLEGPFLAPAHRGAHHEPSLRLPDVATTRRLLDASADTVRMMTLAPELPGAEEVLTCLRDAQVVTAMGHTGATFDQTREAVSRGVAVGTHLFNGMRRPHHREPGPAMSLLDDERVIVELINDGQHVHPAIARIACRAAGQGRLALISDGVAATAAPDGSYRLGRVDIRSFGGKVETADGTSLGGGVVTLDIAVRRAVTVLGLDLVSAVSAATVVPAAALGLADRVGSIAAGRLADLCVLDSDLHLLAVMLGGDWTTRPPVDPTPGPIPASTRAPAG